MRGDAHIAYQAEDGDGPAVLYVAAPVTPIDLLWDDPLAARGLRRLARHGRLMLVDLSGVGASDSVDTRAVPAMQMWMDDIRAVLDHLDVDRATLVTNSEPSLPTLLFAATHPDRVRALVLVNPFARYLRGEASPHGLPPERAEALVAAYRAQTGRGLVGETIAPSRAREPMFRRWLARCERLGAGPGTVSAIYSAWIHTDVSGALESIRAPALVLHRRDDRHARDHPVHVAERIPDARLVTLRGRDNLWFSGDVETLLDHVDEFLAGTRGAVPDDRFLATVLFTDIARSTERAAALGDVAWSALLGRHDDLVRAHVESFQGRLVKTTGDGALATFDGPARAIHCATSLVEAAAAHGLEIRAGLHTGEIQRLGDDIGGLAVHIGARVAALAQAGEVFVSGSVPPLVAGSGIAFSDRGTHALRGVPDRWPILAVDRTSAA
jgi:class 3 adenylate cyclase